MAAIAATATSCTDDNQ
ncbi:Vmc-like lipoprotein signal peptide domain-containing protein [Ectobacillus panaciterrae]